MRISLTQRPTKDMVDLRMWLWAVLWAVILVLELSTRAFRVTADPLAPDLERLVFVTEDINVTANGCDAVTVFHLDRSDPVSRGAHFNSPGRLTATSDFTTVLAGVSLVMPNPKRFQDGPFLVWERYDAESMRWKTQGAVLGDTFAVVGGLAILPDDDSLLVATVADLPASNDPTRPGPVWPRPFHVRRYRISEFRQHPDDSWRLGPLHGEMTLTGIATEILPSRRSTLVHVLTDDGWVATIDPATMDDALPRIRLAPMGADSGAIERMASFQHGTLSPDERYLVSNRYQPAEVIVADLVERRAWSIPMPADVQATTGVAFNWAWHHHGLLAVHGGDKILLFRMDDKGELVAIGRAALEGGFPLVYWPSGPANSLAWSADGRNIIAGGGQYSADDSEFVSIRVLDDGRRMELDRRFTACTSEWDAGTDMANDILTANGLLTPPATATAASTTSPKPSPTVDSPPTRTPVMTPTDTSTPTSTTTLEPSPAPLPVYLPFMIREACARAGDLVDVALVVDLSTSMSRQSESGGRKIDGAMTAATMFVDMLLSPGQGHRVALVGFHDRAWTMEHLTTDNMRLHRTIREWPGLLGEGTRLDLAIGRGADVLNLSRAAGRDPVLVLLTDGLPNRVPTPVSGGTVEDTVLSVAAQAKSAGLEIYTIGLGKPDADDILDRIHAPLLRAVASSSSHFLQTADPEALATIYRDLAGRLRCRDADGR